MILFFSNSFCYTLKALSSACPAEMVGALPYARARRLSSDVLVLEMAVPCGGEKMLFLENGLVFKRYFWFVFQGGL